MTTTFAVVKRNAEKIQAWTEFLNSWPLQYLLSQQANRPFRSCPKPLIQNEAKDKAIDMKRIFYSLANKTHFHKKRFRSQLHFKSESSWNSQMAIWSWFLSWFIPSWLVNISVGDTIAVVKGLNPTQTWIFFQAPFLQLWKLHLKLWWSPFHLPLHPAILKYDFHIFI